MLDIIKDFADLRLDMYVKRKDSLIAKLTKEILVLVPGPGWLGEDVGVRSYLINVDS